MEVSSHYLTSTRGPMNGHQHHMTHGKALKPPMEQ